jgi:glutathione S-transferase
VPYPNAYATANEAAASEAKYLFNCAQRGHANFLENQTSFLISLFVAGLRYPVPAAALGLLWSASRVAYAVGYTSGGSKKGAGGRQLGSFGYISVLGLLGMSVWTAVQMVM